MLAAVETAARGLHADKTHIVVEERREHADGIAPTAHTRHYDRGQPSQPGQHLGARLVADDLLKPAHQRRVRVRPDGAADDVVGVANVGHPVPDRLVGRVLERCRTAVHGHDLGPEQTHLVNVQRLPAHVLATHVDDALEPQGGTRRRRRDSMLTRPGLGDDPALAHAQREQHLADGVVQLVRAGVEQVLPLQPDLRTGAGIAEPASVGHRSRTARELCEPALEVRREVRIGECAGHLGLELLERRDEGFRHIGTPIAVEAAARCCAHRGSTASCADAALAAITNRRTSSGSFSPGRRSNRLDASTPAGRTVAIAVATSSGPRPPASRISRWRATSAASTNGTWWPVPPGRAPRSGTPSSMTSVSGGQSMVLAVAPPSTLKTGMTGTEHAVARSGSTT